MSAPPVTIQRIFGPRGASPAPWQHARLPEFHLGPKDARERLAAVRLVVVGCGSVGMQMIDNGARQGIGGLCVVDPKVLKPESLCTHSSILPEHIGAAKAALAAARAAAICPGADVRFAVGRIQDLRFADLLDFAPTHVLLASDNLHCEMAAATLARQLGVPLIQGSVDGSTLTAEARCFSNRDALAPDPVCLWGDAEFRSLEAGVTYSCAGDVSQGEGISQPETRSIAQLCTLAASLSGIQLVRDVLGLGAPVRDTVVTYCGYTHQTLVTPIRSRAACPADHRVWRRVRSATPLARLSAASFLHLVGHADRSERATFSIVDWTFAEEARCACGLTLQPRLFLPEAEASVRCTCGREASVPRFHARHELNLEVLGGAADQPLASLGADVVHYVKVSIAEDEAFLVVGPEKD